METNKIFWGMDISASGMRAEKRRMEVFANNLANINTTRTQEGGPYRRQEAVLQAGPNLTGVQVVGIKQSQNFRMVYDPEHPDADQYGYVRYPDINLVEEWTKMITASRAYEANISAFNLQKQNYIRTLDILR